MGAGAITEGATIEGYMSTRDLLTTVLPVNGMPEVSTAPPTTAGTAVDTCLVTCSVATGIPDVTMVDGLS